MEETIELPKGYLLMDTVCLLNYIQGKSPDNFDYKQVEEYVRDKKWWIVITLETLYESIQACTDVTFIRRRREQMLGIENLWVADPRGLLSEYHLAPVNVCLDLFLDEAVGLPTLEDNKRQDAKDYLSYKVEGFVWEIISISKILDENKRGVKTYANNSEFNDMIAEAYWKREDNNPYTWGKMVKQYKAFLKLEPKRTTDVMVEERTKGASGVNMHMFKKLVADWFRNGSGKKMMNTLIDYSNLALLNAKGAEGWVYITEEDKFVEYILDSKEETLATRRFYEQYYLKKRRVRDL